MIPLPLCGRSPERATARKQKKKETPGLPVEVKPDVIVHPKTGKEMVRIPAGEFLYGKNKEKVHLDEYWIDKTPVTNAEYSRFVAAAAHKPPQHWQGQMPSDKIADHPVVYISWRDAKAYADWAGLRLPTEQEWEKAARGADGRQYTWGNEWRDDHCNTSEAGIKTTTPVGRFSPRGDSPYGCVDVAGNVFEWTDLWVDEVKNLRVVRGGRGTAPGAARAWTIATATLRTSVSLLSASE
ncbi:MAG TPA: SUMF1/EgtB/PvdO family nonheme iron enzyme [Anaerolineae bacterium]